MTDLEKFILLYESFGIHLISEKSTKDSNIVVHLESFDNPKFDGYFGFCSDVIFDENGKFLSQGFWE
jgi:hypothetical protein